jgi:hypothetical protein
LVPRNLVLRLLNTDRVMHDDIESRA